MAPRIAEAGHEVLQYPTIRSRYGYDAHWHYALGACTADAVRAASLGHNNAIAYRVYEEGLNLGRFEVPYSPGFVGHGSTSTFTHADGMAEVKGFREAPRT